MQHLPTGNPVSPFSSFVGVLGLEQAPTEPCCCLKDVLPHTLLALVLDVLILVLVLVLFLEGGRQNASYRPRATPLPKLPPLSARDSCRGRPKANGRPNISISAAVGGAPALGP